jgi:TPP-dependent pyruvate/acetoin dehydrogenase alpha subunit
VAGGIPIAVGAALSARLSKNQRVAITFFGDGATNQGVFHEALNMAALWKLPCIFFCENNLYAEMTPIGKEASVEHLADRGAAYGMRGVVADGNDVEAVYQATAEAAARARAGEGPTFIEALTYRLAGHMYGDPQNYKPKDEFDAWRRRDPLILARQKLEERGVKPAAIERLQQEVDAEIEEAIKLAREAPEPPPEEVDWYVYADSAGNGSR